MLQHVCQLGYLPNPSADTHSHHLSRPILADELEEVTYDCIDLNLGSIVEWARDLQPRLAEVDIVMRSPDCSQVYCRKGWIGL